VIAGTSFAISVVAHNNGARCAIFAITLTLGRHSEFEPALAVIIAIAYIERERGCGAGISC
jgi:hypothetical protein